VPLSGRPASAVTLTSLQHAGKLIQKDWRITGR
jgi:hypothetical protein